MGLRSLKNAAAASTTAGKSTTVVVQGSAALGDAIRDHKAAKAAEKKALSDKANAEVRMFGEAGQLRLDACRIDRKVHASVKIEAGSESTTATQKGQFIKMGEDASDPIRKIVGANAYCRWFQERTTYSFDESAITDEIADAIIAALGDQVEKVLKVTTQIVPTEAFVTDTTLDDDAAKVALKLRQEGFAKPYKMSFK